MLSLIHIWDSLNVINAFIRWREFGNQSWEYVGSDFDVYVITSWTARIKKQIVKAVTQYDDKNDTKYIEAAVTAEMYRLILNGEYREKSLGNLTANYIFCNHPAKDKNTWHSNEWNALLAVMHQRDADIINRETVRQYFNPVSYTHLDVYKRQGGSCVYEKLFFRRHEKGL